MGLRPAHPEPTIASRVPSGLRRLAWLAGGRHVPTVTGRAVPAAVSAPYRPVTEALQQLLRRRRLPDDPSLAPWLPHLAVLLPGVVPDGPAQPGGGADSPPVRGEAVLQLLDRIKPRGLVVALEDLHWADPDTVALVEYLADNAAGQPLLFAASLRPEPPSPASELARRQRGRDRQRGNTCAESCDRHRERVGQRCRRS